MTMNKRQKENKLVAGLYHIDDKGDKTKCAYCGDIRECVDHCPPLLYTSSVGVKALASAAIPLKTFPCCNTCNRLLSDIDLLTYEDRLAYLYRKTQNKLDGKTLWSKDEIDELKGNLKKMVLARQLEIRRELISRLRGMEKRMAEL
jgi:hypothetical protein